MTEVALSALRIAVAVYVGLAVLCFVRQSRYVYYPDRDVDMTPAAEDMAYANITLKTEDKETIAGWFVPAETGEHTSGLTVLFCHGNAGDIGDRIGSIRTFNSLGYNVLIFDYRGYGDSSGTPTEKGTYLDAMAAWKYLIGDRGIPAERIVLFGRSLGGAVATWLATEVDPGALVIESVFTSAPDMASRMFPLMPTRFVCRFKYDSVDRIGRVGCPVLIAHSRYDEMIPFKHGQRLFGAARDPKLFVEMSGGHNFGGLDADPRYQETLARFLTARVVGTARE